MRRLFYIVSAMATMTCHALSPNPSSQQRTYNYFAFGSNMCSSTMINLRNISPLASTAAMLPSHQLRFNIPGMPGVEPSSASVEPYVGESDALDKTTVVHGTLYKLSEEDFSTICRTEGVPFAYSLHRCRVVPYRGDGKKAGEECLENLMNNDTTGAFGVPAFTLRAARKEWRKSKDIPPSQSYLNLLIRGAVEFKLDEEYLNMLNSIEPGKTFAGFGLAEEMLKWAEKRPR